VIAIIGGGRMGMALAEALAQDGLNQRIHITERGELGVLDRALNQIAEALAFARDQAGERQEDLLAILASMSDGIIATDRQQRILLSNPAAAELLDFPAGQSADKPLWESVRVEALLKAASKVLASGQKEAVRWEPQRGRHLEAALELDPGFQQAGRALAALTSSSAK
jgi:PAS domain-containing protein